jgi:PPOX class probable F420-dependent enzyme
MTAVTLADPKIQAFLATKYVVVLATVDPDGSPLAMAMWLLHDPEALTMISVANLAKVRNLRRDPRVSVVAETGTIGDDAIKGVAVRGRAEFLDESPARRRLVERFLAKYDPQLEKYWNGRVMPPNRVMFRIVPERVRSWGL